MSRDAVVYTYTNNTDPGYRSFVGRVVGFAGAPRLAVAYHYTNNLEHVTNVVRLLETGEARLLEDGTTERTTE